MNEQLALLDTSAWGRLLDDCIAGEHAQLIGMRLEHGELAMTEPLLLEMRCSARDPSDFQALAEELDSLPLLELDSQALRRALSAQAQLAASPQVSHRVKPIDLLVAGVADRHGVSVLHYDSDYDVISRHTDLSFQSVWIAERGSLG